ncbi:bifunctional D-glycero-beta-D-manno-heptose-7-phosphate kinase/D-glycero-beta-D-manno-heptose 1-phosphate adenylyltransferase HldE [Pseudomonas monteilii]|jgi:D-beta-D-heptose 7-phosphate kinase/D-beta-D-heptose 1-phosphate adenosyltransferase|uniref:bifunctional D-glycero-beta-D-manno-heptose-7-phosphate kinase/D-glycero-beta-D-manno-heptose 1-phosphate adenylyltransferase HldE n=1 Tax=Pseudomonas alabamensis TaxID=3064349 RepID=UPI000745BE7A|nr:MULTISPECIES: bifunctional D-glycero-beta-D-manno-heptose-7-phosphate kinase/D-glycero-beta-D-manno-heptose 1-phosphate adenylyltransferase HldE [Pseudomonas]AMA47366.1 bifunctional heptose 7-phosphate kinase/heptose 1-phosphate adenyltransferase [Pseudomonas monteilii]MDO7910662.1 bifunctional D-glycero-beta-D-manno-heptose-7-phosphate kinase/D-glycero-beta-D-manno-heptose 1-phosphate adenylyltransferase HldE [Pseudomonas sp. 22-AL-CL-001]
MKLTMPRFESAPVLVVGDVMLDRYWHGGTSRISPEAPVPVVKVDQIEDRPGGAANVALNIAALGAPALLVGVTGEDEAAESLANSLEAAGVQAALQRIEHQPTIVKLRVMSRHQQLLRIDFEEAFDTDTQALQQSVEALLDQVKVLVISDYGKGALKNHQALIQAAVARGIPVLADPKGKDFSIYRGASLITPNLAEFEAIVGHCVDEADLVAKGAALMSELELGALLVTRGEHGMTLLRPDHAALHLPARAREVFDVTGAGDTVISTLAAAIAAEEDLPCAVGLANLAAGIVVGKLGTAAISAPELRRAIQREEGSERGVLSLEQLLLAIDDARAHNERIVFTNGCFDILHAGHVTYLEQARALGDRLIVAVNDDASVSRLKGPGRPINSVDRRMAVLAGLGAVDWVISFSESTPESLLTEVRPDVLVKGGDYGVEQVVGADIVRAYGGTVKVLGLVENSSTTSIVEKIRSR